jgi:hypothetical protein
MPVAGRSLRHPAPACSVLTRFAILAALVSKRRLPGTGSPSLPFPRGRAVGQLVGCGSAAGGVSRTRQSSASAVMKSVVPSALKQQLAVA